MILEHAYDPTGGLVLPVAHRHAAPERGAAVKLQGDPDGLVLDGCVIGVEARSETSWLLFIDVDEHQPGAAELARWLTDHGDLGIMIS
jgi:hypothetical protein